MMKRKSRSVWSVPAQQTGFTQAGFTLVELLVVMVILGLLVALVAPNYIGRVDKSKREATRAQVANFGAALDMFRLDVGRYPNSQEGLNALRQRPSGSDRWDGPLVIKGVQSVDDCRKAADSGATAVMISNHGGRQLDSSPAPVDCIADVADAAVSMLVVPKVDRL